VLVVANELPQVSVTQRLLHALCCADDAAAHTQDDISPSQLRSLWDGVGKPLLRVGKGGVQVLCFPLTVVHHNDIAYKETETVNSSC